MKYKLQLISPGFRDMNTAEFKSLMFRFWFPTLSLPMIAACTPGDFEVSFTDEIFEGIDFDKPIDIVGITGMTAQIMRAYKIADIYRKKGVTVIIGGIHASVLPDEAKMHADSVIVGEGETLWSSALSDFKNGTLRPVYRSDVFMNLVDMPWPKRDIYKNKPIPRIGTINSIQTSRGCPFDCDFCSVTRFFGNKFRLRPIDDVIDEIKSLKSKIVSLIDDNIVGNAKYAEEFFIKLANLEVWWTGQSSISLATDSRLLDLCAKSGCKGLLVGIESLNQKNLQSIGKKTNKVYQYMESIKKIQDKGIRVLGSFIFGLDDDDPSVFEQTVKFVKESGMAVPLFNILTPYPGTRIYDKLILENRILVADWSYYTSTNVVYMPKKMRPEELQDGYKWAYQQIHGDINSRVNYQKSSGWF